MQIQTPNSQLFKSYALAEHAITLEFGNEIDEHVAEKVSSFKALLNEYPFTGMLSLVPAYTTLSIFFDPLAVILNPSLEGIDCYEKVMNYLAQIEEKLSARKSTLQPDVLSIPVCYGNEHGPDLREVANHTNLSPSEVISMHSSAVYKVHMIGFTPGFAYLGGMADQLSTPRKKTPARAVAAGSVGIAGTQTGIYPIQSPGGWQIIGCTPLKLFEIERSAPALLKAGDVVKFESITIEEFNKLKRK